MDSSNCPVGYKGTIDSTSYRRRVYIDKAL